MPRCELTGKAPEVKNLVSHSNIKTKSVALPNVQQKRLFSNLLGEMVSLKIASSTIKSIDHVGSIDKFILNQDDDRLSKEPSLLRPACFVSSAAKALNVRRKRSNPWA